MSITQTAATLESYDIKIRELKAVEDALSRDLRNIDVAIYFSIGLTRGIGLSSLMFFIFAIISIANPGPVGLTILILSVAIACAIWFMRRWNNRKKRDTDRRKIVQHPTCETHRDLVDALAVQHVV